MIPRWGVQNGIKYSQKRSILKICPVCGNLFIHNSKGKKKYCRDLCSIKAKKMQMVAVHQKFIQNRDNFEHANYMRKLYATGKLSKKRWTVGTDIIPKPKLNEDGVTDWESYHQTLHDKLQKLGLA